MPSDSKPVLLLILEVRSHRTSSLKYYYWILLWKNQSYVYQNYLYTCTRDLMAHIVNGSLYNKSWWTMNTLKIYYQTVLMYWVNRFWTVWYVWTTFCCFMLTFFASYFLLINSWQIYVIKAFNNNTLAVSLFNFQTPFTGRFVWDSL